MVGQPPEATAEDDIFTRTAPSDTSLVFAAGHHSYLAWENFSRLALEQLNPHFSLIPLHITYKTGRLVQNQVITFRNDTQEISLFAHPPFTSISSWATTRPWLQQTLKKLSPQGCQAALQNTCESCLVVDSPVSRASRGRIHTFDAGYLRTSKSHSQRFGAPAGRWR